MKKIIISLSLILALFHISMAVDSNTLDCMKKILDKGYGSNTAREVCYGFGETEIDCLMYLLESGYGPQTGRENCAGVSNSELECMKEILSRGYGIYTASQSCKD